MTKRSTKTLRIQAIEALPKGTHQIAPRLYLRRYDKDRRTVLYRWSTTANGKSKGHVKSLGAWDRQRYGHYLAEAGRATEALDAGRDPAVVLDEGIAPGTFREAAESYMADNLPAFTSALHRKQWRDSIERLYPELGKVRIDQLEIGHIVKALGADWLRVPVLARRLRARLELIIDYAIARSDIQRTNPAALGLLRHRLPKQPKRRVTPMRAIDRSKIAALFDALGKAELVSSEALRFLILTVARTHEVRGMKWSEINWQDAIWTVPAARMKLRKPHRVALSSPALEILRAMQDRRCCDFVFYGADRAGHISKDVMALAMARVGFGDGTPHGLRSVFKDWARNSTPKPDWELVELSLAHEVGNAVERAYGRDDLVELRRPLMAAWGVFVTGQPAPEKLSTETSVDRKAQNKPQKRSALRLVA